MIGEGRMMYGIAAITDGNPFEKVVGWKDDLVLYDPDAFRKFEAAFPHDAAQMINFGNPYAGDFSIKAVLEADADFVLLDVGNLFKAEETGLIEKLDAVEVDVVFIDFRRKPRTFWLRSEHDVPKGRGPSHAGLRSYRVSSRTWHRTLALVGSFSDDNAELFRRLSAPLFWPSRPAAARHALNGHYDFSDGISACEAVVGRRDVLDAEGSVVQDRSQGAGIGDFGQITQDGPMRRATDIV